MRSSTARFTLDPPIESNQTAVDTATSTLVELIAVLSNGCLRNSRTGESSEEVLFDTEVDGSRYLVLKMPKPNHCRVQLSPREQEIVRMVAKGHPNKVIADVLNISSWTVCTHLRRIFAKLGVGSRAAMVAQLLEIGFPCGEHGRPFAPNAHARK